MSGIGTSALANWDGSQSQSLAQRRNESRSHSRSQSWGSNLGAGVPSGSSLGVGVVSGSSSSSDGGLASALGPVLGSSTGLGAPFSLSVSTSHRQATSASPSPNPNLSLFGSPIPSPNSTPFASPNFNPPRPSPHSNLNVNPNVSPDPRPRPTLGPNSPRRPSVGSGSEVGIGMVPLPRQIQQQQQHPQALPQLRPILPQPPAMTQYSPSQPIMNPNLNTFYQHSSQSQGSLPAPVRGRPRGSRGGRGAQPLARNSNDSSRSTLLDTSASMSQSHQHHEQIPFHSSAQLNKIPITGTGQRKIAPAPPALAIGMRQPDPVIVARGPKLEPGAQRRLEPEPEPLSLASSSLTQFRPESEPVSIPGLELGDETRTLASPQPWPPPCPTPSVLPPTAPIQQAESKPKPQPRTRLFLSHVLAPPFPSDANRASYFKPHPNDLGRLEECLGLFGYSDIKRKRGRPRKNKDKCVQNVEPGVGPKWIASGSASVISISDDDEEEEEPRSPNKGPPIPNPKPDLKPTLPKPKAKSKTNSLPTSAPTSVPTLPNLPKIKSKTKVPTTPSIKPGLTPGTTQYTNLHDALNASTMHNHNDEDEYYGVVGSSSGPSGSKSKSQSQSKSGEGEGRERARTLSLVPKEVIEREKEREREKLLVPKELKESKATTTVASASSSTPKKQKQKRVSEIDPPRKMVRLHDSSAPVPVPVPASTFTAAPTLASAPIPAFAPTLAPNPASASTSASGPISSLSAPSPLPLPFPSTSMPPSSSPSSSSIPTTSASRTPSVTPTAMELVKTTKRKVKPTFKAKQEQEQDSDLGFTESGLISVPVSVSNDIPQLQLPRIPGSYIYFPSSDAYEPGSELELELENDDELVLLYVGSRDDFMLSTPASVGTRKGRGRRLRVLGYDDSGSGAEASSNTSTGLAYGVMDLNLDMHTEDHNKHPEPSPDSESDQDIPTKRRIFMHRIKMINTRHLKDTWFKTERNIMLAERVALMKMKKMGKEKEKETGNGNGNRWAKRLFGATEGVGAGSRHLLRNPDGEYCYGRLDGEGEWEGDLTCSDTEEDQDSPKLSRGRTLESRFQPQQVRSEKALGKRKAEHVNVGVEGTGTKRRKAMEHVEIGHNSTRRSSPKPYNKDVFLFDPRDNGDDLYLHDQGVVGMEMSGIMNMNLDAPLASDAELDVSMLLSGVAFDTTTGSSIPGTDVGHRVGYEGGGGEALMINSSFFSADPGYRTGTGASASHSLGIELGIGLRRGRGGGMEFLNKGEDDTGSGKEADVELDMRESQPILTLAPHQLLPKRQQSKFASSSLASSSSSSKSNPKSVYYTGDALPPRATQRVISLLPRPGIKTDLSRKTSSHGHDLLEPEYRFEETVVVNRYSPPPPPSLAQVMPHGSDSPTPSDDRQDEADSLLDTAGVAVAGTSVGAPEVGAVLSTNGKARRKAKARKGRSDDDDDDQGAPGPSSRPSGSRRRLRIDSPSVPSSINSTHVHSISISPTITTDQPVLNLNKVNAQMAEVVDDDGTEELKPEYIPRPTRSGRGSRVVPAVASTSMVVSTNDDESEYEEPLGKAPTKNAKGKGKEPGTKTIAPKQDWPVGSIDYFCHQDRSKSRKLFMKCSTCSLRYCIRCITTRYADILEFDESRKDFECFRCQGICNCTTCSRKRGVKYFKTIDFTTSAQKASLKPSSSVTKKSSSKRLTSTPNKSSSLEATTFRPAYLPSASARPQRKPQEKQPYGKITDLAPIVADIDVTEPLVFWGTIYDREGAPIARGFAPTSNLDKLWAKDEEEVVFAKPLVPSTNNRTESTTPRTPQSRVFVGDVQPQWGLGDHPKTSVLGETKEGSDAKNVEADEVAETNSNSSQSPTKKIRYYVGNPPLPSPISPHARANTSRSTSISHINHVAVAVDVDDSQSKAESTAGEGETAEAADTEEQSGDMEVDASPVDPQDPSLVNLEVNIKHSADIDVDIVAEESEGSMQTGDVGSQEDENEVPAGKMDVDEAADGDPSANSDMEIESDADTDDDLIDETKVANAIVEVDVDDDEPADEGSVVVLDEVESPSTARDIESVAENESDSDTATEDLSEALRDVDASPAEELYEDYFGSPLTDIDD